MSDAWIDFQTAQTNQLNSIPVKAAAAVLTSQSAAIPAEDMTDGSINGGYYRLSYWYGVTTPASVTSDLQVDFAYEYGGVTRTLKGDDLAGNSTSEFAQDVAFIPVDGNTPVTYTVTYASLGTPMSYAIFISLENVPL
jgi:hypothetical protein